MKVVTYAVLGHLGDVVQRDLVRVARHVLGVLALTEGHSTHDTGVGVLEGGVSAKLRALLLV